MPPLWIATDQEGGMVSRLSPPLTLLPQLSNLIDSIAVDHSKDEVVNYAKTHGSELAEVGVNLNFAPVVDLNKGVINPMDALLKADLRNELDQQALEKSRRRLEAIS